MALFCFSVFSAINSGKISEKYLDNRNNDIIIHITNKYGGGTAKKQEKTCLVLFSTQIHFKTRQEPKPEIEKRNTPYLVLIYPINPARVQAGNSKLIIIIILITVPVT